MLVFEAPSTASTLQSTKMEDKKRMPSKAERRAMQPPAGGATRAAAGGASVCLHACCFAYLLAIASVREVAAG